MTIILTFAPHISRARILTWINMALKFCPFGEPEIEYSPMTEEEFRQVH